MAVSGLSVMNDVKLIVKTPNQRIGDIHVSCEIGWTVQRLKEHLSSVYPTKPCKTIQRLIYAGRLLQDHLTLTDVLSKDNDSRIHTVHIVCSASGNGIGISSNEVPCNQANAAELSSLNAHVMPTNANPQSVIDNANGVRHRVPTNTSSSTQQTTPNLQSSLPTDQTEQNHQWQQYMQSMQQYWSAYYQQQQAMAAMYHQNVNPSYFGSMAFTPMYSSNPSMTTPMVPHVPAGPVPDIANNGTTEVNQQPDANAQAAPPQAEQQQQEVRQAAAAVAAAAPQNLPRLNAGGAMFDDEEEEEGPGRQRDWLDWIYTFLRCGVLLSVMYFYSSASRLVLVLLLGFIVYLYQNGWFSLPQRQQPQPQQQSVQQNQDTQDEANEDGDANNNDETLPQQNPNNTVLINTPSTMSLLFTFVSSFFTSLIPQRPPPLQQP